MTEPVATIPPRPTLTMLILQVVDEEGHPGVAGTSYVFESIHPYRFVSRQAAAAVGTMMCDRHGCDGFRLHTPGYVPPPVPTPGFDDSGMPF